MPTNGLSLVGFITDQQQAINHLRSACVASGNATDQQLIADWNTAKGVLGAPISNAGTPNIRPISASHNAYIQQVAQLPWIAPVLATYPSWSFALVEIEPLLAYQLIVDTVRSQTHGSNLSTPPTADELLNMCLPTAPPNEPMTATQVTPESKSMMITSALNVRIQNHGYFQNVGIAGIAIAPVLNLVHVTRFSAQCFLHNGYHRAYQARTSGATHMPCLLRDVATLDMAGVRTDGTTFPPLLFQSANPPTVGHFTQRGRSFPIHVRRFKRYIHLSWSEYALPDK